MRYITIGLAIAWFGVHCFAEEIGDCECKQVIGDGFREIVCGTKSIFTMSNLEEFDCSQRRNNTSLNNLAKMSMMSFNQTTELTLLYLYGDDKDTIEIVTFTYLENVDTVNLDNISIQYVDPDIFVNNHNLRTVVLSNNPLVKISRTTSILNAPSVENLYLHRCMLKTINKDMFSQLKNLKHLDLSSNHLEVIPTNTFTGMHSLTFLEINDNRWKCGCRFERLNDFVLELMEHAVTSDEYDSMKIEPVRCLLENENGVETWSETLERSQCDESDVKYCIYKECVKKDEPTRSVVSSDNEVSYDGKIDCVNGCIPEQDCLTIKYGIPYVYLVAGGLILVFAAVFVCVAQCWRKRDRHVSKLNEDRSRYNANIRVAEEGNRKVTKSSSKVRLISVNSDPGLLGNQTSPVIPHIPVDCEQFSFDQCP